MTRLSRLSLFRKKQNFSDNRDNREAIIAISRFALGPCMAPRSLYSPLSSLPPSVLSTAICSLYGLLFSLRPFILSIILSSLNIPLSSAKKAKLPVLFREMFCQTRFVKTPRVVAIYFILAVIAIIAIITIITQAKCSAIITK